MVSRLRTFLRDQRGNAMVTVAIGVIMIFGLAVVAVDIGTSSLVKTQLQNAADAAVLAGIYSWVQSDDSTQGIAAAIDFAGRNDAMIAQDGGWNTPGDVAIDATDIDFPPPDFPGQKKLRVTTHRTQEKGDNFRTYFMRVLDADRDWAEMTARATASFFWVCGAGCIKPWAPPDRWADVDSNNVFDPGVDFYDPITTGYTDDDLGTQINLKLGNGNKEDFGVEWYYAIDYPPLNDGNPIEGGDRYRDWIQGCVDEGVQIDPGDSVQIEPGNMVGPTSQGVGDLIALDPNAEWDPVSGGIINSDFNTSPRIIKAALFDPSTGVGKYPTGRNYVVVVKIMVLFLENTSGAAEVTGRFIRLNEPGGEVCEDQTSPTFLYKTALIE